MSNLFDNYNVKIIKEDNEIHFSCLIHNNNFNFTLNKDKHEGNFDLFYSQLKNTKYKIEHRQLNNFKIIYDKFNYSFNLKKYIFTRKKFNY